MTTVIDDDEDEDYVPEGLLELVKEAEETFEANTSFLSSSLPAEDSILNLHESFEASTSFLAVPKSTIDIGDERITTTTTMTTTFTSRFVVEDDDNGEEFAAQGFPFFEEETKEDLYAMGDEDVLIRPVDSAEAPAPRDVVAIVEDAKPEFAAEATPEQADIFLATADGSSIEDITTTTTDVDAFTSTQNGNGSPEPFPAPQSESPLENKDSVDFGDPLSRLEDKHSSDSTNDEAPSPQANVLPSSKTSLSLSISPATQDRSCEEDSPRTTGGTVTPKSPPRSSRRASVPAFVRTNWSRPLEIATQNHFVPMLPTTTTANAKSLLRSRRSPYSAISPPPPSSTKAASTTVVESPSHNSVAQKVSSLESAGQEEPTWSPIDGSVPHPATVTPPRPLDDANNQNQESFRDQNPVSSAPQGADRENEDAELTPKAAGPTIAPESSAAELDIAPDSSPSTSVQVGPQKLTEEQAQLSVHPDDDRSCDKTGGYSREQVIDVGASESAPRSKENELSPESPAPDDRETSADGAVEARALQQRGPAEGVLTGECSPSPASVSTPATESTNEQGTIQKRDSVPEQIDANNKQLSHDDKSIDSPSGAEASSSHPAPGTPQETRDTVGDSRVPSRKRTLESSQFELGPTKGTKQHRTNKEEKSVSRIECKKVKHHPTVPKSPRPAGCGAVREKPQKQQAEPQTPEKMRGRRDDKTVGSAKRPTKSGAAASPKAAGRGPRATTHSKALVPLALSADVKPHKKVTVPKSPKLHTSARRNEMRKERRAKKEEAKIPEPNEETTAIVFFEKKDKKPKRRFTIPKPFNFLTDRRANADSRHTKKDKQDSVPTFKARPVPRSLYTPNSLKYPSRVPKEDRSSTLLALPAPKQSSPKASYNFLKPHKVRPEQQREDADKHTQVVFRARPVPRAIRGEPSIPVRLIKSPARSKNKSHETRREEPAYAFKARPVLTSAKSPGSKSIKSNREKTPATPQRSLPPPKYISL